jgi:hypothetical protein
LQNVRNLRSAAAGVALGGVLLAIMVPLVFVLLPLGIPGASAELGVLLAGALGAVALVCAIIAVTAAIRTQTKPQLAEQLFLFSTVGYLLSVGIAIILLGKYAPFQLGSVIITVGMPTLCFLVATLLMYMSMDRSGTEPAQA